MGRYDNPRLTKDDFDLLVDPKDKEVRIDIHKDRRVVFDSDAPELEDLFIGYRKAQKEVDEQKTKMENLVEQMLQVLKVRDIETGEVKNLIDVLESEMYALDDRKKQIVNLKDFTLRIQSKENIMSFSAEYKPSVNHSKAWGELASFLTTINEANEATRGSQTKLLEIMENILEKTKSPQGRRFLGVTRIRKRKQVHEAFEIGESISSLWESIKNVVMKIASRIRKNTNDWFSTSKDIDRFLSKYEAELTTEGRSMSVIKNPTSLKDEWRSLNREGRIMKESKGEIVVGSRVKYSRNFLRSIGEITGTMPFAKGVVTELKPLSKETMLATIDWGKDKGEVPDTVNVKNLVLVGDPESSSF